MSPTLGSLRRSRCLLAAPGWAVGLPDLTFQSIESVLQSVVSKLRTARYFGLRLVTLA